MKTRRGVATKGRDTEEHSLYLASAQTYRPIPRESPCPVSFCWAWRGFPGRSPSSSPETWVQGWKHPNPTGTHRTELMSLNCPITWLQVQQNFPTLTRGRSILNTKRRVCYQAGNLNYILCIFLCEDNVLLTHISHNGLLADVQKLLLCKGERVLMLQVYLRRPLTQACLNLGFGCWTLTINLNKERHHFTGLTFTASWRIWWIVFGPLSMKALRGTQLFSRSSTVSCSRKRILAGNSLLFIKDRIRPKYWSIKDWRKGGERGVRTGRPWTYSMAASFRLALAVSQLGL